MSRFAANVSLLYPEHSPLDRIGAAAHDGFAAVEHFAGGERGLAALPGREREFAASIEAVLDFAQPARPGPGGTSAGLGWVPRLGISLVRSRSPG